MGHVRKELERDSSAERKRVVFFFSIVIFINDVIVNAASALVSDHGACCERPH
jgi:hypothetical protein